MNFLNDLKVCDRTTTHATLPKAFLDDLKPILARLHAAATLPPSGAASNSNAGGVETVIVAPAGAASGAARETPIDASVAEPSAQALFGVEDLAHLQSRRLDANSLHAQARSALNAKIRFFGENPLATADYHPVTTQDWSTWREYIASLLAADRIV